MYVKRIIELALSDEQVAKMIRAFKGLVCSYCGSANVKRSDKSPSALFENYLRLTSKHKLYSS